MIYGLVTAIHVIACLLLILVILLQSGRGGGLSEMMGGGAHQQQKVFGTQTSSFLTKGTSYAAIIFMITSISLGVLTSTRQKSLLQSAELKPIFDAAQVQTQQMTQDAATMPKVEVKPMADAAQEVAAGE